MTQWGARYLHEPSLFPRRISGEAWGDESVAIRLAGESYHIGGLAPAQAASLENRYGPRLTRPPQPDSATSIHVYRAPRSDFRTIDTRGWEYALDLDWQPDTLAIAGMRLMARAGLALGRAGLWTCVDDPAEFWGVLENVLRPLLAARLLDRGGLLVHSAAVGGFLFPSPSGGGKSTIARMGLRAGLPVLSDDLNAVVPDGTQMMILPLPFTGDLVEEDLSTEAQPLRAVVAMEKGAVDGARGMTQAEAVSLLTRCAPYVNQDPHRTTALLDRAAEIASAAGRHRLTFRLDGEVWPILRALS